MRQIFAEMPVTFIDMTPRFYIALQDGPFDDREFLTKEDAERARRKLSKFNRSTPCVMEKRHD